MLRVSGQDLHGDWSDSKAHVSPLGGHDARQLGPGGRLCDPLAM